MRYDDEPDVDDVDDYEDGPSDKQLGHDIDEALAKVRPERYDAEDKDWMDSVVEIVAQALAERPVEEVHRTDARRRVYRREAEATKRVNRLLRDIETTGRLPIGWGDGDQWREVLFDLLRLPLSIARHRIRFGIASAQDLEQWELESGREQDKWVKARANSRAGARLLIAWLKEQGVQSVEDLQAVDPEHAP